MHNRKTNRKVKKIRKRFVSVKRKIGSTFFSDEAQFAQEIKWKVTITYYCYENPHAVHKVPLI
jgi:hypothetical protein